MMGRQSKVTYARPPLTEVVIGIQFERIAGLDAARLGLLWGRFRARFPKTELKPPLTPAVERIGLLGEIVDAPRLEVMSEVRPRLWFLSEEGDELVQIQDDRFIRNWRRNSSRDVPYPRFESLEPRFISDLSDFVAYLEDEDLGDIRVEQCEVTYVNIIKREDVWQSHGQLSRVFRGWSPDYEDHVGLPLETAQARFTHVLRDQGGEFVGRLRCSIESAFAADAQAGGSTEPVFKLVLVARGWPVGEGIDGIRAFFDIGHQAIVTSFDRMVTPLMQATWGRV